MAGLVGRTPSEVFATFRTYISKLINQTISHAPLTLSPTVRDKASVFLVGPEPGSSAPLLGSPYRLYAAQSLLVTQIGKSEWRLKTLKYTYRIEEKLANGDTVCHFRFEYESRQLNKTTYPRYHLHVPGVMNATKTLDLEKLHVPTGWVTIEDVIRFLIVELGVTPISPDWDNILWRNEELFREWTGKIAPTKP